MSAYTQTKIYKTEILWNRHLSVHYQTEIYTENNNRYPTAKSHNMDTYIIKLLCVFVMIDIGSLLRQFKSVMGDWLCLVDLSHLKQCSAYNSSAGDTAYFI